MIRILLFIVSLALLRSTSSKSRKDSARCSSQGDFPTLCKTKQIQEWNCEFFISELLDFAALYRNRPNIHNVHGMGVNHAFSLWITLRKLKPEHVIESGVYRGQGTWLIRQTLGISAKIYSIDPRKPDETVYIDRNNITRYFTGTDFKDFSQIQWSSLITRKSDRENALLVLDDHMSAIKRVQQAASFGFTNLWYDDNWKYGKVDVYSFNTICSPTKPLQEHVLYLDNFGSFRENITLGEHYDNLKYLQSALDVYYEFPALFNYCDMHTFVQANRSCLGKARAHSFWHDDLKSTSDFISIDFMTYFPPYVKLKVDAGSISTVNTTPYKFKTMSSKVSGASKASGKSDIPLH